MAYTFFSDSVITEPSEMLDLHGVWMHDPLDPEGTTRNFLYGRDSRASQLSVGGTAHVFAGRKFPIMEFGEHQEDKVSVSFIVAHGIDYYAKRLEVQRFVENKRVIFYRDSRSRALYGATEGYSEDDDSQGSVVSFDLTRVNVEETYL